MRSFQDLLEVGDNESNRMEFVRECISEYRSSDMYRKARTAELYAKKQNVTIMQYQKFLYTAQGKQVPDDFSPNYKLRSNFFYRFITQENQYLLGNGITWTDDSTKDKLDPKFEYTLRKMGKNALTAGVCYGFYDYDTLKMFKATEYRPLIDETDGSHKAGIYFWQMAPEKPQRAVLYELDGYTEYMWEDGKGSIVRPKTKYKVTQIGDAVDEAQGTMVYDGENYPGFPIIPLYGNPEHQSELEGLREQIDCYDLIKSGFANNVDEAGFIYWAIQNAGGMDEVDVADFVQKMRTLHAANMDDDGAKAEAHTVEVPTQAREALLTRLSADLYRDFMGLDTKEISGGAATATEIKAAYEPLDQKTDDYEAQIKEFLGDILSLAGIDDTPTFTRRKIVNTAEEANMILASAQYTSSEYTTRKLLSLFGDMDKVEEVMAQQMNDEGARFESGEAE